MEENQEDLLYSLSEISKLTGLSNDLVRLYEKEFDLKIARTKEIGGHRRYTEANLREIREIQAQLQQQKLSYKQVRNLRAGLLPSAANETAAAIVSEAAELKEMREKMENMEKKMDKLIEMNGEMANAMDKQKEYIENALKTRDEALMLELRDRLAEKQQQPRGFFNFFRGNKK